MYITTNKLQLTMNKLQNIMQFHKRLVDVYYAYIIVVKQLIKTDKIHQHTTHIPNQVKYRQP